MNELDPIYHKAQEGMTLQNTTFWKEKTKHNRSLKMGILLTCLINKSNYKTILLLLSK